MSITRLWLRTIVRGMRLWRAAPDFFRSLPREVPTRLRQIERAIAQGFSKFSAWRGRRTEQRAAARAAAMVARSLRWRNDPATDKQRAFAAQLRIKHAARITKGELSDLISEKLEREKR